MTARFFAPPRSSARGWPSTTSASAELLVGLYRKGTGEPTITWPQLVDEVLCVGWIDGVRRGIDERSYSIRITPRKARSNWSAVNVRRYGELDAEGRVLPAGRAAWERREDAARRSTPTSASTRPSTPSRRPASAPCPRRGRSSARWRRPTGAPRCTGWSARSGPRRRERRLTQLIEDSGRRAGRSEGMPAEPPRVDLGASGERTRDMKLTVTGATGLIGSRLVRALKARGDEVTVLSRNPAKAREALGVDAVALGPDGRPRARRGPRPAATR